MREREELREKRKYRYTLIRIRFPDGLVLQVSNIKILKELKTYMSIHKAYNGLNYNYREHFLSMKNFAPLLNSSPRL